MLAAGLSVFSCKDKYDLDSKQPEGLNSIYGYLTEQGNYTNYLRLIDDLGQSEILSKTGSKTLFVADDAAFATFFANGDNLWKVSSYDQLTLAQKKLLLYSSMIDNPYTSTMLSTATGPVKGEVCRRVSSLTIQDSVPVLEKNSPVLPNNKYFNEIKSAHDKIVLYCDASAASPMVHFTNKFITTNMIQPSDIDFIYNSHQTGASPFQGNDVFVNNARVTEADIFCKNGFIHKVNKVIVPLDNMAEIIRKNPQSRNYSSIIERFAAPYFNSNDKNNEDGILLTKQYNLNHNKDVDSVFQKRYFSKASQGSSESAGNMFNYDIHKQTVSTTSLLKFDPGWNGYYPQAKSKGGNGLLEDMGVMIVPTDAALDAYWAGDGAELYDSYHRDLAKIPTDMLYPLVNVNMLPSFVTSVPSKFTEVLDDANENLGITTADIDHVEIGCNGVVYFTKKVFPPKSYSTVLFPVLIDENHKIVRKAIEELSYDSYLNSTSAKYTFLIPSPEALQSYIDPVSFVTGSPKLWEFVWEPTSANFYARIYNAKPVGGIWERDGESIGSVGLDESTGRAYGVGRIVVNSDGTVAHVYDGKSEYLNNRFVDILDNIICVQEYTTGQEYYRTKGNSFVRIKDNGRYVAGSAQENQANPLTIIGQPTKDKKNGVAYVVNGVVMGTELSVAGQLDAHKEVFSDFLELMTDAGVINATNPGDKWTAVDRQHGNLLNIKEYERVGAEKRPTGIPSTTLTTTTYFTNNFHYTVYAPTNAAMAEAHAAGLPTHQDLQDAIVYDRDMNEIFKQEAEAKGEDQKIFSQRADTIREIMLDFFKYHIHDNAVFVDGGDNAKAGDEYTTSKGRFLPAFNVAEEGKYTIEDEWHIMVDGKVYKSRTSLKGIDPHETAVEYETGRFTSGRAYEVRVTSSASGMTVQDIMGNTVNVLSDARYHNILARETWIKGLDVDKTDAQDLKIDNASTVVIQGIEHPLYYDTPENMFNYTYKELAGNKRKNF